MISWSSEMCPNEEVLVVDEAESRTNSQPTYIVQPHSSPEVIDIIQAVNSTTRGNRILSLMQSEDPDIIVARKDVCEVIRLCVGALVRDLQTLYPTTQQKIDLAKAMVTAIPSLKSDREDIEGYEHLFDPVSRTGSIEFRLKTLRVSLSPSKKKNKRKLETTKSKSISLPNEESMDEESMADKIAWLQYQVPSDMYRQEIFKTMEETFAVRRAYIIKENPSIHEILAKYPKLRDFDGALLDAEFKELYKNAGTFLGKFPSFYTPRILTFIGKSRIDVHDRHSMVPDENLRALLMLTDMLPVTGYGRKKGTKGFPSSLLIRYLGVNASLDEAMENCEDNQPGLLCIGHKSNAENKYFLKLDKTAVACGSCPMKAFDYLYKCHYVFNVKYSSQLLLLYNFMDYLIYKVRSGPARGCVENTNNLLYNIKL